MQCATARARKCSSVRSDQAAVEMHFLVAIVECRVRLLTMLAASNPTLRRVVLKQLCNKV